ncbi:MAG: HipA N-terminal domain-containing protein, partial [Inhella sp.]
MLPAGGRRLNIFINQEQLGTLHEDNDLWTLAYLPQWRDRPGSFDLSPALPRSQLLHRDGATLRPVQWYFDNLLPEEKLRELIAADALAFRIHPAELPLRGDIAHAGGVAKGLRRRFRVAAGER